MDVSISKLKLLGTRIIAGVLTASMLLSTATAALAVGRTTPEEEPGQVTEPVTTPDDNNNNNNVTEPDTTEEPVYSTPLVLDQPTIGFTAEQTTVRVRATVTDVRYLGALSSLEEFASFFPADVDLDECEYLTSDLRESIGQMDEATRRSYRGQAIGKLNVTEQFLWSTVFNGYDYKDYIKIEVVDYSVRDASEDMAPSISCDVDITWVGPTETVAETQTTAGSQNGVSSITPSESELQELLNGATSNNGSTTNNRNPLEESQEVQDFLYDMYKNGGLTQENTTGYDLSYFDERLKAEQAASGGSLAGNGTTSLDLESLLNGETGTSTQDSGFSLISTSTQDTTYNNKEENNDDQAPAAPATEETNQSEDETGTVPGTVTVPVDGETAVAPDGGDTALEPADAATEPDPVLDEKVEPPLEEDAVALDAPGDDGAALAATQPEGDGELEATQNENQDSQTGNDQAGDSSSPDADQTADGSQQSGGLSMEELLAQMGAGSQTIVPQAGGVTNTVFDNFQRKLTKDEAELYGEDAVVQTAVVRPTIDSTGSAVYETYFSVSVPESDLSTAGMAYFFGTATVPETPGSDTDVDDPNKDDDGEKKEEPGDKADEDKPQEDQNQEEKENNGSSTPCPSRPPATRSPITATTRPSRPCGRMS